MKTFKTVLLTILAVFMVEFVIFIILLFRPHEVARYESPNGAYVLIVKAESRPMAMPGSGGAGSAKAIVIVEDKQGNEVAHSDDAPYFDATVDLIQVKWYLNRQEVSYAIARTIDLRTGEFLY